MEGVIVVLLIEMVGGNQQVELVAGLEGDGTADRIGVAVVDIGAGELVLAIAVAAIVFARHAGEDLVGHQRAADTAFEHHGIIIAVAGAGIAAQLLGGFLGDQVDGAGGGAATVQGALWTTQHFDTFDVIEARQLRRRPRDQHAILQEGDSAIGAQINAGQADAANEGPIDTELVADRQIGNGRGERANVLDTAGADHVATNRGNGGGDLRQRLRTAGGSDDDVGDAIAGGSRRLAKGRRRDSHGPCKQ